MIPKPDRWAETRCAGVVVMWRLLVSLSRDDAAEIADVIEEREPGVQTDRVSVAPYMPEADLTALAERCSIVPGPCPVQVTGQELQWNRNVP